MNLGNYLYFFFTYKLVLQSGCQHTVIIFPLEGFGGWFQGKPAHNASVPPRSLDVAYHTDVQTPNPRRRTNVQQLTCNIDLSWYFYHIFFSFVLIELKPFVLRGKVLGDK